MEKLIFSTMSLDQIKSKLVGEPERKRTENGALRNSRAK